MENNCCETRYGDVACRPETNGILIRGQRGRILSVLYAAGGAEPHPAVLLLHGIPGCEQALDVALALRRCGFHVMTMHYSGCWGSDGDYSLRHDLEDANTVLDYMLHDAKLNIDTSRVYAVGHSLGGFVCGQLTAHRPEIRAGVMLMPCNIGRLPVLDQEDPARAAILRDILADSAPWLNGTSAAALEQEAVENSEAFRLENLAEQLAAKPVLCFGGSLDIYTPPEQNIDPVLRAVKAVGGTQIEARVYPTDHAFSDYRMDICRQVCDFLRPLAGL